LDAIPLLEHQELDGATWIHQRYTYPEIWRQGAESRAIRPDQGYLS